MSDTFIGRLQAELEAAQAKIANQSERIRYLEGATNHATGTPLSQAHAKIAALEAQLEADRVVDPAQMKLVEITEGEQ